jgi:PAS domain S-box-containing protein
MNRMSDQEGIKLKVLVLEDSARDLELLQTRLSDAGYRLNLSHVETEADFTHSLRENSFDLILSDYKLPGFDAFGALQISQEICPLTPFICISGTIGEETAVELLKLGAVDFVSKERPERLPMVVKRALEEAKVKADYQTAIKTLRESQELLSATQRIAKIGGWIWDEKLKTMTWTDEAYQIHGMEPGEIAPGSPEHIKLSMACYDENDRPKIESAFMQCVEKGTAYSLDYPITTAQGQRKWIRTSAQAELENGKVIKVYGNIIDITERKQAEIALQEKKDLLERVFDSSFDLIALTDLEGNFTLIGNSHAILGYEIEYLYGKNVMDFVHPDDVANVQREFVHFLQSGEDRKVEYRNRRSDGTYLWFETIGTILKNEKGNPEQILFNTRNISERKKAEDALRQSEEMMRTSQSVAQICSYSTNLNVNEIEHSCWVCSPEFYNIFGIDETYPHTIEGWAGFIHPHFHDDVVAYHESVIRERKSFNREYKIIRINDGAERWVHGTGELEYDNHGKPIRMHGAIQDITERKRVEIVKQIQYNIAQAMIATKNSNELFNSVQKELNRVIDARNFMIACYNEETGMLRSMADADEKDNLREWSAEKSATGYVIKNGQTVLLKREEVLRLKDQGVLEIVGTPSAAWLGVPLIIEGKIIGAAVVQNYDNPHVYDQHSIEIMELLAHLLSMYLGRQRAEEKAQESDKLKTAFLHNISHEIRTPLNVILGFGELLSKKDHSPEVKNNMLKIVKQSSNRLLNTITDYIDMARIVSGTLEVQKKKFSLQSVIEETIIEVNPLCETNKIELKTSIPKQLSDQWLFSDKELVHKTLLILLDNALKFTSQGEIIVGCRAVSEFVEFYVQDTGTGIANDKLEMVFDRFVQEETADTRGYEGSGLGLSIARELVTLLGGSIYVTSEKGKGSTFSFTVPDGINALEKEPKNVQSTKITQDKPLVLVAEDDELNYLYMEEVLQQAECDYLLAKNGEEAVALCKQHPEITLVLMDIKMPVMDGLEAARHIRDFRPKVHIIATTAYAQTGDEQRFLAAGFDGYLPKPIGTEKLISLLDNN